MEASRPKHDWYQDDDSITIVLYVPNIQKDDVTVSNKGRNLSVEIIGSSGAEELPVVLEFNLSGDVQPFGDVNGLSITMKTVQLKLYKTKAGHWETLEETVAEGLTEDSACGIKVTERFSEALLEAELAEIEPSEPNEKFMKLLQDIYAKGDDDTKRAMIKSFVGFAL